MLGSTAIDRLYTVQASHFPGIVADISLENLSSLSLDDNQHYSYCKELTLPLPPETTPGIQDLNLPDVNKNIGNNHTLENNVLHHINEYNINTKVFADGTEGDGISSRVNSNLHDKQLLKPVSKDAVSDCDELNRTDHCNSSHDKVIADYYDTQASRVDHVLFNENLSIDKRATVMTDSGDLCSSVLSTDSESCLKTMHENPIERVSKPLQEQLLCSNESKHAVNSNDCRNYDDRIGKEFSHSKADINNKKEKDRHLFPIVNIRTLDDDTEGAYEISISNLYSSALSSSTASNDEAETDSADYHSNGNYCHQSVADKNKFDYSSNLQNQLHDVNSSILKPPIEYVASPVKNSNYNSRQISPYTEYDQLKKNTRNVHPHRGIVLDEEISTDNNRASQAKTLLRNKSANYISEETKPNAASKNKRHTQSSFENKEAIDHSNHLLFRSYSDEGRQHKNVEVGENGRSSASDIYDLQKRRRRRPRKLPEIPKQKAKEINLQLDVSNDQKPLRAHDPMSMSLHDELQLALNSEMNGVDQSPVQQAIPAIMSQSLTFESSYNFQTSSSISQNNQFSSQMVNSIVSLQELGSPEAIDPPAFRQSAGFFGVNFEELFNSELLKQQLDLQNQQKLLLRKLYNERGRQSYTSAAECDSGYTTQDPEGCHSRPSSAGPLLSHSSCDAACRQANSRDEYYSKCGYGGEEKYYNSHGCDVMRSSTMSTSMSSSQGSTMDCYIDDVPKYKTDCSAKIVCRPAMNSQVVNAISDIVMSKTLPEKTMLQKDQIEDIKQSPPEQLALKNQYENFTIQRMIEETQNEKKRLEIKAKADDFYKFTADDSSPGDGAVPSGAESEAEITHRCCHKFVPRHSDELFIEIGDPIYVEREDDDLWCEGINLRTKDRGIFPSVCATDLNFLDGEGDGSCKPVRFTTRMLGSVQVKYAKGTNVVTQAINKVAMSRRLTLTSNPPPVCSLEVNNYGIRISDKKSRRNSSSSSNKMPRSLSQILGQKSMTRSIEEEGPKHQEFNHFYSLKNVTFCGLHPTNHKYFAFITKHPLEAKFACHVLMSEDSTSSIADAIGASFKQYYQQYLAATHPTEDIYLEN